MKPKDNQIYPEEMPEEAWAIYCKMAYPNGHTELGRLKAAFLAGIGAMAGAAINYNRNATKAEASLSLHEIMIANLVAATQLSELQPNNTTQVWRN
jgi:hypothetical protein